VTVRKENAPEDADDESRELAANGFIFLLSNGPLIAISSPKKHNRYAKCKPPACGRAGHAQRQLQ